MTIELRKFPVRVVDTLTGEEGISTIVLSKQELQAAQMVGQSSKELICRRYRRHELKVLDIGKAERKTVTIDLDVLWERG